MVEKLYQRNTMIALAVGIFSWSMGWYGMVLLSDETNAYFPKPTYNQCIGLIFTIILAIISWFRFIYTVRGHN